MNSVRYYVGVDIGKKKKCNRCNDGPPARAYHRRREFTFTNNNHNEGI